MEEPPAPCHGPSLLIKGGSGAAFHGLGWSYSCDGGVCYESAEATGQTLDFLGYCWCQKLVCCPLLC